VSDVVVRPVQEGEQLAWLRAANRAFHHPRATTAEDAALRAPRWAQQRLVGAFDGDRPVGTFRSWDEALPVPGGTAPADLVSSVTVASTHRRRGVLTRMMTADLAAAHERGCALALLIASEAPIYGRFGFGAAVEATTLVVDQPAALARTPAGTDEVEVELVEAADLRPVAPDLYAAVAAGCPGAVARREWWWDQVLGIVPTPGEDADKLRPALLARDASGAVVGLARYRVEERWEGMLARSVLHVEDLLATTPAATAALWRALLAIDLVAVVRAEARPVGDPLAELLADRRRAAQVERADFLWARLLDVPAALSARRYALPGRAVVEVVDELGLAAGRYRLEAGADGEASCERTAAEPDVVLDAGALGAASLGQTPLVTLHAAGRVEERRPGAVRALGALLAWQPSTWPTLTGF
jgi:predicted acetyltransferase